ncbi:glycosyltransferase family 2 protein [Brasilonema octagenarum UFV-E1]|uniref:Glycosyltransferase family 2 protein n=1 Tax=Brasilonema sennae CENA114 TaxID=415709 RepID=A0A856MJJ2_9CYAN|nr:glycosyltransferase family A protein [Brasilonema sennae]QDL11545.1 glycosyltransferase family 2 protein [Brasilonema sennae CENA114]QDL17926.1 glycosyltransferase family 2 protein [Brasilonema octagenarum UFV-E1]
MSETRVTVAIPTYNRASLLKFSLESVLAQDYPDFQVLVLDNASDDDTEAVVRSFAQQDERITYIRNQTNIGVLGNWNRAIELNTSPYLTILSDDDLMLPGLISESVQALDEHAQVAFSFALVRFIDIDGNLLHFQETKKIADGVINGLDFLEQTVSWQGCPVYTSSIFLRKSALAVVGSFDSPHTKHTFDLTMVYRMTAHFDILFLRKELVHVRLHPGQITETDWRYDRNGPVGVMAEIIDAVSYLLESDRAADPEYRKWLAERLLALNARQSEFAHLALPYMQHTWEERLQFATQEVAKLIPPDESFILVDDGQWQYEAIAGGRAIPFVEKDGLYWGPPEDDTTAIEEVERWEQKGVKFIVFGWPSFWWFDYYSGFYRHLRSRYPRVFKNSRLVVFDLQS